MAVGDRIDPYLSFRFKVEIEGLVAGGFSEASGLQAQIETEDYQEGGNNGFAHKLPKTTSYPNVVLKRGLTDSAAFWQWLRSTSNRGAKIDRKTVRIIQLDSLGHEKVSWRCLQAYPVKWVGADMKATENSTFVETLELIHCGIVQSGNEASPASPTSLPTITVGVSSVETLSVSVHLGVSL